MGSINPLSITDQSQLSSVPEDYWQHVLNDLPNELPFAKLWTGGWCPPGLRQPSAARPLGYVQDGMLQVLGRRNLRGMRPVLLLSDLHSRLPARPRRRLPEEAVLRQSTVHVV